jgi:DNA-binding transcriptional regulator YiaG
MDRRTNKDFQAALDRFELSQSEFAKMIKTDKNAINRWFNGNARVHGAAWALLDLFDELPELAQTMKRLRDDQNHPLPQARRTRTGVR